MLIAGDIYQRSAPQADAMELFSNFISKLSELGIKIFIISGNHDSPQRISYFSSLIRSSGVYVSESFDGKLQGISVQDDYGEIVIWMLPFLRPIYVKRKLPDQKITTYQEAVEAVLRETPIDKKNRNILIAHQFITGSEISESEELSVGGLDNIDASIFDDFDYVALGHIHKPQHVKRETLRYAGSPLKYSFSEVNHKKSIAIISMHEKGDLTIDLEPIYPAHDVRKVEGTLDELIHMPYSEDYIWVTVNDENTPLDARITLRSVFPNMMKFSIKNSKTKEDTIVSVKEDIANKSIQELFADFYRLQNNNQEMSDQHKKEFEKILKELEEEI